MLAIVGKAVPNPNNNDIEYYLEEFRKLHREHGRFAYAWTFNPKPFAIDCMRKSCDRHDDVFLYLPEEGGLSRLRMRVLDFHHDERSEGIACPDEWISYCPMNLRGKRAFPGNSPIHFWFLIEAIEDLQSPIELLTDFRPVFNRAKPPNYKEWGQNYFAFMQP